MDREIFNNTYTPIVVNTGGKLVLIDTGVGEAGFAQSKGAVGQFMTNLAAAGINPDEIDTVIISHYHGDHVNGLLKADNTLAFPKAEMLVPANEHKFWMDDGEMSRAAPGRMEGLFKNNRASLRRRGAQACTHLRVGQGSGAGHHGGRYAGSYAGPHLARGRSRARRRCSCRATSPTCLTVRA